MSYKFVVPDVMRSHYEVPCVTIDHWWAQLGIGIQGTVDTAAYPNVVSSNTDYGVLTFID